MRRWRKSLPIWKGLERTGTAIIKIFSRVRSNSTRYIMRRSRWRVFKRKDDPSARNSSKAADVDKKAKQAIAVDTFLEFKN
jgi:hypothetical protein